MFFIRLTLIFRAEYRKKSLAQFEACKEENQVLRASLDEYRGAAESVLEVAFPREYLRENPTAHLEDLKKAPQKLRRITWDAVVESATQAFVLVKSHYPRVELRRFTEGYSADADDDKIDALTSEARPVAESLVADIDVDRRPLPSS